MLRRTILALSTLCLAVSACGDTKRVAEFIPTPPTRLVCDAAGTRPTIPPEYKIDWTTVAAAPTVAVAVERAKSEVGKLIGTVRTREGVVAGYVLDIEGKLFICSNNAQWRREFEENLAARTGQQP